MDEPRTAQPLVKPVIDVNLRREWVHTMKRRCMICEVTEADTYKLRYPTGLEVHHIVKRPRADEWCNLLLVCSRCHLRIEGERVAWNDKVYEPLGMGTALWAKERADPGNWDPDRLLALWGRACLPEPIACREAAVGNDARSGREGYRSPPVR